MRISPFVFVYNILTASVAAGLDLKNVVGDGYPNEFKYSYSFFTDDGDSCNSCKLCTGTRIGLLFDPNHKNFCVECDEAKGLCTTFQVAATFENPWTMKFFSLISSDMTTDDTDPSSVVLNGSMDGTTWVTLLSTDDYDSSGIFKKRMIDQTYKLDNSNKYSHYSIQYKLKKTSARMHIGTSAITKVYVKECSAQIVSDVTGRNILPYDTQTVIEELSSHPSYEPSDQPSFSPSRPPTKAPTSRQATLSDRFIGCFKDLYDTDGRDLPHSKGKSHVNTCLQACAKEGYEFMGRQYHNQCWCGNSHGKYGTSTSCNKCLEDGNNHNYGGSVNCVFTTSTLTLTEFSPAKIQVKQGQTIGEISNPTPEWIISFGLRFSNDVDLKTHHGILRFAFSSSTKGCCDYGDRHPAFMTGKGDGSIFLISGTKNIPNHNGYGGNFVMNKDYNIKAVAVGKRAELYVDGVRIVNLEQDKTIRPTYGKPLKVYAEKQAAATSAVISNLIYVHVKNNPTKAPTTTPTKPPGTCGGGRTGNGRCANGWCCSRHGWCGWDSAWCNDRAPITG